MPLLILATGTCKDKSILALEAEYLKRLPKAWGVEVRELKASKHTSPEQARLEEQSFHLAALDKLPANAVPILLHEHAPPVTSSAFAKSVGQWLDAGKLPVFVIGGAAGFGPEALARVTNRLSLSSMTFPHQLCRALLAEQIYRAHTICVGHPYHRP